LRGVRLTGLLQAAAAVTAVFSVATLADHLHRYLEMFSHFRLQYLLVAAALALLLFVVRSRRWAFLMLGITAINAVPVAPWYLTDANASAPTDSSIKLLLANVYSGNGNSQQLIDFVLAEEADIVFLQEVTDKWNRQLTVLRDTYQFSLNIPHEDNFGIAALSRHPFVSARVIESPPFKFPTLIVELEIDGGTMTFVTTHPMPPIGKSGFDGRNEQLAAIATSMKEIDGPRVLIGDLNTTMWGHHYQELIDETGLVNARHGFGVIPSWPTQLPFAMIPLDQCLVSSDIEVLDIRTGPRIGSDHLPLIVELALLEHSSEYAK
jgi:endonuclease/exonuclease/phosphatase (EEP) superfamily protein YafD